MATPQHVYVTGKGSVSLGSKIYKPGDKIPAELYKDRRQALRMQLAEGLVSTRPTGADNKEITYDRGEPAQPLPAEADLYDAKRKRLLPPPIQSTVMNQHAIAESLQDLRRNQQDKEAAEARDKAEDARDNPPVEKVAGPLSEEERIELEAVLDEAEDAKPEVSEADEAEALLASLDAEDDLLDSIDDDGEDDEEDDYEEDDEEN